MTGACLRKVGRSIEPVLRRLRYRNFGWIIAWEITHNCNLNCRYCLQEHRRGHPDPGRGLERIITRQPHMVIVGGGEPLLVPNLGAILQKINRECRHPRIVVTTNLTLKFRTIAQILPHIHTLHVSIDGLDEVNMGQRGVPASQVLGNLRAVVAEKQRTGSTLPQILCAAVVTRDSFRHLEPLFAELVAIDPTVIITLGAVEPPGNPLSLLNDPHLTEEFFELYWRWRKRYPVEVVGYLGNRSTRSKEKVRPEHQVAARNTVLCYRQYFRSKIGPDGEEVCCKPTYFLDFFKGRMQDAIRRRDIRHLGLDAMRLARVLAIPPYNPKCYFPCKCEEFLDDIIMARTPGDLPPQTELFHGRDFGPEGVVAEAFIRRQFNPRFSLAWLGGVMRTGRGDSDRGEFGPQKTDRGART